MRLRVADLAGILDGKDREEFCDVIQLPVQLIWELDRRCTGTKAQKALIRAAEAARALHEAFANLSSPRQVAFIAIESDLVNRIN